VSNFWSCLLFSDLKWTDLTNAWLFSPLRDNVISIRFPWINLAPFFGKEFNTDRMRSEQLSPSKTSKKKYDWKDIRILTWVMRSKRNWPNFLASIQPHFRTCFILLTSVLTKGNTSRMSSFPWMISIPLKQNQIIQKHSSRSWKNFKDERIHLMLQKIFGNSLSLSYEFELHL
jgi:hypothetical protein